MFSKNANKNEFVENGDPSKRYLKFTKSIETQKFINTKKKHLHVWNQSKLKEYISLWKDNILDQN